MLYCNLAYLLHHIKFGDNIYFSNGKIYSVEQLHDQYLIDLYDNDYSLHTFDLKKLFLNEKIEKINDYIIPKFDINSLLNDKYYQNDNKIKDIIKTHDSLWLPLSFQAAYDAFKSERCYASLYDLSIKPNIYDLIKWGRAHYKKIYLEPLSETFNILHNEYQDDILLIEFSNEILKENESIIFNDKDELLLYRYIDLSHIKKIYFLSQLAVDKFLAKIKNIPLHNYIKSKCITDPYLFDKSLLGKW